MGKAMTPMDVATANADRFWSRLKMELELLTAENIAELVKIHIDTVWKWQAAGKLPQPDIKRGPKFTRWYRTTIEKWIEAGCKAELMEAAR